MSKTLYCCKLSMDKMYEHTISDAQAQQKWQEHTIYHHELHPGPLYSIDTPPPTVSGALHIGHVFSYTQTDILARYKRMNGFSVLYPFGTDDNGLATERFVEKKTGVQAYKVGRSEFIKLCLQEVTIAQDEFVKLWQRIGLSIDWRYRYSTISPFARAISQASFIDLYKKGYIYRKFEPALYCTVCRTSVAQAELDDKEVSTFFNDIVFADEHGNDLIISTTRPEMLPSCVALLYHPNDERYKRLHNKTARVPLFNTLVPILEDELVNPEKGTGLVMCCTFGDKTDIEWYKKHKLPYKQAIGIDGIFMQDTGFLAGLKTKDARAKVIDELRNAGLLLRQKEIIHAVNIHERCKNEIEFLQLKQWFVNILEHKATFLQLADEIMWAPSFMKARYTNWVENLNWDWCISRQRFYGIPFPVWYCNDCHELILADPKNLPVDPQEQSLEQCPHCKNNNITPDTDVMDTWNTSALTPYIAMALHTQNNNPIERKSVSSFIPMGMRPQAHDIIRTWAFYAITRSWMHHETIPWKEIVISGHVLSDQKEKISKSKDNNKLAPERLLEEYPADVIRYWTASGRLGHDVAFSENQFKIGQRLITKIWNAFRFIETHIESAPPSLPQGLGLVNEWILHTISNTFNTYAQYLENHEFSLALDAIEQFFWQDFCDNYLELIKNQLFNPQEYTQEEVTATRWTLYHLGLRILQLYAPYLPHITETIYASLYQAKEKTISIHQTKFATMQTAYVFKESAAAMAVIVELISEVRKLKTSKQLSLKVSLTQLLIYVPEESYINAIKQGEQIIRGVTHAQTIVMQEGTLQEPSLEQQGDAWYAKLALTKRSA